jgi:hypothetical protein
MDKKTAHPLEILALKKKHIKSNVNIPSPLLDTSEGGFVMCLVAPTCSGKTYVISNLIHNVNFGIKREFDEIIFISPTLKHDANLKYMENMEDIVQISDLESLENLDNVLNGIIKTQIDAGDDKKPILVILDDCVSYFNNHSVLNNLPQLSRHYKISFIVSTQSYMALPIRLRKNASEYLIFRIYNIKDYKAVEEEVGSEYENFTSIYNEATETKYNFLFLNKREMTAHINFTTLLWAK